MLQLRINHTWPQIAVNKTPSRLEIQNPGYTLDMSVSQAKLRVESTLPKITIDQSQCFSEAGLKGNTDFLAEMVSISKNAMLSSVGRISEQGNAMADLPNAANAISDQAYYNAYEQFNKDYNMDTIPKSRPRIEVIMGQIDTTVTEGQVRNNTVPKPVTMQYIKGSIEVYLKQRGHIDVSFVDVKG